MKFRTHPLIVLIIIYAVLALVYMWATPPFEASDELWHVGVVYHITTTGELPVQIPGVETPWEQEGSQPPLYYLAVAALASTVGMSDFDAVRQLNPHVVAGDPAITGNKNLVLHNATSAEPRGTVLAVYLGRLLSIVLGGVTLGAVYASARVFVPERPAVAVLAAGLTAFNPMFLFISASVNNDNLVTALNSLLLWQMLLMLRDGLSARRSALTALLLALTSLAKLSGLVIVPAIALASLYAAARRKDWRGLLTLWLLMGSVWAVVAGWWYIRNITLYGELFGTYTMATVAGPRAEPFTLATMLEEFEGFRVAYWGWFGAVNIIAAPAYYVVMDLVTAVGIFGLGVHVWRRRTDRDHLVRTGLLALPLLIGTAAVIMWTAQTYASQGRLLFPYIVATSVLLAVGLTELRLPVRPAVFALGTFALVVPFVTIAPAYSAPRPQNALPATAKPVYARFGTVELVGYDIPDQRYQPGDVLPVTVYWKVQEPDIRDLSLWLHAVSDTGEVIGKVDSYPGGGTLKTTSWASGIYADRYGIRLDKEAEGRFPLRVQVGWWHYPSGENVESVGKTGEKLDAVMLAAGGFAGAITDTDESRFTRVDAAYGGVIRLIGYQLQGDNLTLLWEALGTPADDYTVFVHVVGDEPDLLGQGDAPPRFPTRYWRAGERYVSEHILTYPALLNPGVYTVLVGLYQPTSLERLENGHPDRAYPLVTFTVESS